MRPILLLVIAAAALGGCQTTPVAPPPELQLLDAAPLTLAPDCLASGSYLVEFTVAPTGRAREITPPEAPSCVREALTAWVASFQYAPPDVPTPSAVEWLMTTAPRS